jgi:hypothetical protein
VPFANALLNRFIAPRGVDLVPGMIDARNGL